MSRYTVNQIPEERGVVGRNRSVNLSQTVADGRVEGCSTWGRGGMIQKTFDNGGVETIYYVKIATYTRSRLVPDQGWNSTTS